MEFIQKLSSQGISCNYGITDRFKTSFLSVDFVLPLSEENASGMSLLAGVLFRGCNKYPQMKDISRYMARNYGVSLTISAKRSSLTLPVPLVLTRTDKGFATPIA